MTSRSATFTLPRYTAPSRRLSLASRPSDSGSLLDDKGAVRGDTGRTSTDSMSESGYDTVDTVSCPFSRTQIARMSVGR